MSGELYMQELLEEEEVRQARAARRESRVPPIGHDQNDSITPPVSDPVPAVHKPDAAATLPSINVLEASPVATPAQQPVSFSVAETSSQFELPVSSEERPASNRMTTIDVRLHSTIYCSCSAVLFTVLYCSWTVGAEKSRLLVPHVFIVCDIFTASFSTSSSSATQSKMVPRRLSISTT